MKENSLKNILSSNQGFSKNSNTNSLEDECWSFDLIDRSNLSEYNKNYKFYFTTFEKHTKSAWAIPLKDKSG